MISILFGAGASFGGEMHHLTPALGNDLFDELDSLQGDFFRLPENIKEEFRRHGFEMGMLAVPNNSVVINALQKEIAMYLCKFTPSIENAYFRLFRSLRKNLSDINILTLNYDLLIENAILMNGFKQVYYGATDAPKPSVLKVHGSSNFVPTIPNGIIFQGNVIIGYEAFHETGGISYLNGKDAVLQWCKSKQNLDFSPVMCMYNKEKRNVINPSYLMKVKGEYLDIIRRTNVLAIVGVKYVEHDNHIWDVIFECSPELIIVDPYPSCDFIEKLKELNIKYRIIKKSFFYCVPKLSLAIRTAGGF